VADSAWPTPGDRAIAFDLTADPGETAPIRLPDAAVLPGLAALLDDIPGLHIEVDNASDRPWHARFTNAAVSTSALTTPRPLAILCCEFSDDALEVTVPAASTVYLDPAGSSGWLGVRAPDPIPAWCPIGHDSDNRHPPGFCPIRLRAG
jgi:hypothetical protein